MRFSLSEYQPTQYSTDSKIWWDSPKELVNFSSRSRPGLTVSESLRTKLPDFIFLNKYHLPTFLQAICKFSFSTANPHTPWGPPPRTLVQWEKKREKKKKKLQLGAMNQLEEDFEKNNFTSGDLSVHQRG